MDLLRLILDYFSLEQRILLPPNIGADFPVPVDLTEPIPLIWQVALYLALMGGIVAQSYLDTLRQGKRWHLDRQTIIVGAIIALLAFPMVYQNAGLDASQPTLVQLALVFTAGLGYQSALITLMNPRPKRRRTRKRTTRRR